MLDLDLLDRRTLDHHSTTNTQLWFRLFTSLRMAFPSLVITIPPIGSSNIYEDTDGKLRERRGVRCSSVLVSASHLHHGPRAEAGPDHIRDGLKGKHRFVIEASLNDRSQKRRDDLTTDLRSVDVASLDFTSRLSLYVLVCRLNSKLLNLN